MKFILTTVVAIVAVIFTQAPASAHFIWATVENGQARFALLENIREAPSAKFEKYVANLSTDCGGKSLLLGAAKDGARYAAVPTGQGIVSAESIVGAKEHEGESYLLVYHARGAVSLATAGTPTKSPAELLARQEGKELVVSVRQEGAPVPQGDVWVQWPGDEVPSSVQTNPQGEARVPWPVTKQVGGFVGLRVLVKEAKAGEAGGKHYNAVHHWTTLTFPVTGVATEKPFSQILRESYAHNHEIVGGSAFNQAVFAGKLTKAQLEVHLQQRALIHNEVHRILSGADPASHVPYSPAQKNVLVLLFSDLISLGSNWPTEAQAHPLTQAFLKEIRDSEKQGPYFALGVQHIYYGGITNGGRIIGAKIGETVNFTPTYYEKSDGYANYLVEVNKITDPAARQEMIRGGQAAYRYIIASSNEDIFKH